LARDVGISGSTAGCWLSLLERSGRFWLGDAKWSELPGLAEARRLRQVAAELPAGSVAAMALLCRAPHAFPLGEGVEALPAEAVATAWGLVPTAPIVTNHS